MKSSGIEELGERVQSILRRHGFEVEILSYPVEHSRRSIDMLAKREGEARIFIKVAEDAAALPASELRELRRASAVLSAKPLLVADSEAGEQIEDIVAYERVGVYTVSSEGLRRIVEGEGIYVVRRQGRFYMRIDGEKLREAREKKGYSLGDVAAILGVSRRSVYLYEHGSIDITLDKAIRLLEVFGEEVFKPIEILENSDYPVYDAGGQRCDTSNEAYVVEAARQAGAKVIHMKHTAADIAVATTASKAVILVDHGRRDNVEERAEEAAKIGRYADAELYALVESKTMKPDLEGKGFTVFVNPQELTAHLLARSGRGQT